MIPIELQEAPREAPGAGPGELKKCTFQRYLIILPVGTNFAFWGAGVGAGGQKVDKFS